MSTKAEDVSIQALSPELRLGAGLCVSVVGGVGVGGVPSAREIEAIPENERNTATNIKHRADLAKVIALFPFPGSETIQKHGQIPRNKQDTLPALSPKPPRVSRK